MTTVVNLNRVRKAKARVAAEQQAAENRLRFGRSKLEKQRDRAEAGQAAAKLDGHRLDLPKS